MPTLTPKKCALIIGLLASTSSFASLGDCTYYNSSSGKSEAVPNSELRKIEGVSMIHGCDEKIIIVEAYEDQPEPDLSIMYLSEYYGDDNECRYQFLGKASSLSVYCKRNTP